MFVSILQRFGFDVPTLSRQPLQSRANQSTQPRAIAEAHPEAASQRRQAVKAKSAKATKVTKPASKAVVKPKVLAKALIKTAAKTASKTVTETKAKTAAKADKFAGKAAVKPAKIVKPVVKAVAKKVAKPPVKVKPAVKKPVVNVAPKPVAKKPPSQVSVASKTAAKKLPQSVPKMALKAAPKTAQVPATLVKAKNLPAVVVIPVAAPKPPVSNGLPPPPPLKPGRRSSSRALAHMPPPAPMVPTHAPDAAKASYSTMTERVIAPPPHVAAKKDPKLANNWKTKTAQTLTDEEVKAMPDTEYMNDMQLAFFRHKLSILKQDIHNSAGATTEHLREDTVVVPDPADRATIEEEHALELRTRDRERKLLKKIEQSIARIDSGDYGYCDETGEPIGVGRLIARPTASLSLEAQQRRELKQKMFGD